MEHVPVNDDNEKKQPAPLLEQIQSCHQTFLRFQEEAKKASVSLARERESTPTQCTRLIKPLFQFDDHIETFCVLLQQIPLPDHINKQRHEILIVFQKIAPSLNDLKQRRDVFASGNVQGEWARSQRDEILNATRTLEQNLSDFNELLGAILNAHSALKRINNDNNFDGLPDNVENPNKHQAELASTDRANSSERQQTFLLMQLYGLLEKYTSDLDLQEICQIVRISYSRLSGTSHAERAFSLTQQLYNENRLSELEEELRQRLPGRFPDTPHNA